MRACPECHTPYPDDQVVCPIDGQALGRAAPMKLAAGVTVATRAEHGRSRRAVGGSTGGRSVSMPIYVANQTENDLLGSTLGSYRVLSDLGKGGMGQVYLAEHVKLGRKVALKVLRPEFAAMRDAVGRFFQEAKAVSRIRHKNIVDVLDFVELPDGITFIVMELLEGMTLGDMFRRHNEIRVRQGLAMAVQVCDGLEAAHLEGIIHRDLKPDNIFICSPGGEERVKLLDFGVAKLIGETDVGWQTMQGSVVGTPAYMSPEQAAGIAVDHRADIYALGTILYEIFTGRRVFEAKSFGEFVLKHMSHEPVPPRELVGTPRLPKELERTILRCLQKKPEDRYQMVAQLRTALVEATASLENTSADLRTPQKRGRRSLVALGALGGLGVAAIVALALGLRSPGPGAAEERGGTAAATVPPAPQDLAPIVEQLPGAQRKRVQIHFHSEPEGAQVVDSSGAVLGETPLSREIDGDGREREYLIRRDGFREKRLRVPCDQDRTVLAVLDRAGGTASAPVRSERTRSERVERERPDRSERGESGSKPNRIKIDEHVTVDPFKDQ